MGTSFAGLIAGTIAFFLEVTMANSQIIILAIIATSAATFISRFMGALTSEKVSVKSKIFQWFNCVAYSTLAALLGRMIIFPSGVLSDLRDFIKNNSCFNLYWNFLSNKKKFGNTNNFFCDIS